LTKEEKKKLAEDRKLLERPKTLQRLPHNISGPSTAVLLANRTGVDS
jgi:hypothetical protein